MTTRIAVQPPFISGDIARALQAANRQQLETREDGALAVREAQRRVDQLAALFQSDRNRAVPEFDPVEPVTAKRFGKAFQVASAWWRYESRADADLNTNHAIIVTTGDRSQEVRIDLPQIKRVAAVVSPFPNNDSQGLTWWQCLPAGKDRLVLIFYVQVINATETGVGISTPEPTESSFPPNPGFGDVFEYVMYDTLSTQYSNPQVNAIVKAVVVSSTGINVVDCPDELRTLLQKAYTYVTGVSIDDSYVNTGYKKTLTYWTRFDDNRGEWYWYEALPPDYEDIPRLQSRIVTTYANSNRWETDAYVWLYLLRGYGYGKLVDRESRTIGYEQDPGYGWTPAVFSYLKNYGGEFHVQQSDPSLTQLRGDATNYKYIRDQYFPEDAPPFLLTSGYQPDAATAAGIDTTADYWYFRAPDATTASAVSTADFNASAIGQIRRNGGVFKVEPISSDYIQGGTKFADLGLSQQPADGGLIPRAPFDEIPALAWDWGRPVACWLQLQELGFTASDLMLSADEAQALAAADPAIVAFRF